MSAENNQMLKKKLRSRQRFCRVDWDVVPAVCVAINGVVSLDPTPVGPSGRLQLFIAFCASYQRDGIRAVSNSAAPASSDDLGRMPKIVTSQGNMLRWWWGAVRPAARRAFVNGSMANQHTTTLFNTTTQTLLVNVKHPVLKAVAQHNKKNKKAPVTAHVSHSVLRMPLSREFSDFSHCAETSAVCRGVALLRRANFWKRDSPGRVDTSSAVSSRAPIWRFWYEGRTWPTRRPPFTTLNLITTDDQTVANW